MKKYRKIFTTLFVCIVVFNTLNAQRIAEIENDIKSFSRLSNTNKDSAYYFINIAYKKSMAINNDSLIARTSYNFGFYYYYNEKNILKATHYINNAIFFAEKAKFNRVKAFSYNQLGIINAEENKNNEALRLYLKSLKVAEQYNLAECKSNVLINLGNLYKSEKDTVKSLNYYNQNIVNAQQNDLYPQLLSGYMNAAVIYTNKNTEKSIAFYDKALIIAQKINDLQSEFYIHINIVDLTLKKKKKKDFEIVDYHIKKAENIQQQLNDDSLLFYINFNTGGYYRAKNQFDNAIIYYSKSLHDSKKNIATDQLLNLYTALYETHLIKNDYKKAYLFKEKFHYLSDSLFTIEKNKSFNEIQTKYEVEKKNLKIDLLSKEKTISEGKRKNSLFVGFAIVLGLLLLILFYRNRIKFQKRINEKEHKIFLQEKNRLTQEQELKRILGVVEGQDAERNRIAKDIHDGVGGELAGIKLKLSQVNSGINDVKIDEIVSQIGGVFQNLRSISHNLSSNYITDKNLEQLLLDIIDEYEQRNEFEVEMLIFPDKSLGELNENVKLQLYRIIQELFTNISKHAKAKNVKINITNHPDDLNIIIEDDGVGFKSTVNKGIGLKNIEERLATINGSFVVESEIGKGCLFILDIKK